MPKQLYACEICGKIHRSVVRAQSCERKGRPTLAFHRGEEFDLPELAQPGRIAKILDHRVVLRFGKHVNQYQVDYAGNVRWYMEATIRDWIQHKTFVRR